MLGKVEFHSLRKVWGELDWVWAMRDVRVTFPWKMVFVCFVALLFYKLFYRRTPSWNIDCLGH